jgi:hypothetical protein
MVPISPGGTFIVKDAVYAIRLRINPEIMESDIRMNEGAVSLSDPLILIGFHDRIGFDHQPVIIYYATKPVLDPLP